MKNLLITLSLFCSTAVLAQIDTLQTTIDKYRIESRSITYVNIYELQGTQAEVKDKVIKYVSGNPKLSLIQSSISNDQIEGSFSNVIIDFKKYGYSRGSMPMWVIPPSSGNFTIQFKDGRYRVIVKNIRTLQPGTVLNFNLDETFITKDNMLAQSERPMGRKAYFTLGKTMDELFTVKEIKQDW